MYNENEIENTTITSTEPNKSSAIKNIQQLFPSRTKDECLLELKKNPSVYRTYLNWPDKWKSRFLEFMEGKKSLPLTYDPFFKKLFNPDIYPERLSRLISSIIGTNVIVKCILSNEDSMLPSTSLLLLDIIVQLEDGSIANVEIQKIPYTFPGKRMSCYSADLLLRQYTRVKGEKGSTFTYQDLKTVYTIVMFENSPKECKTADLADIYLHHGKAAFDTGIDLRLLQEYYVVALDVFRKSKYSKDINELNAWLSLLTATTMDDLAALISDYPWMETICTDMSEYLYHPEEVVTMFSEALRKLDENTVNYMIDELKKERDEAVTALAEKDAALAEKDVALAEKDATVSEMSAEIATLKAQLAALNK
uniref:PD-(D/E)XK nuclease family transposase n=2 Tax=Coprococcus sp. TaxID=2049024 RepID=UPI004028A370